MKWKCKQIKEVFRKKPKGCPKKNGSKAGIAKRESKKTGQVDKRKKKGRPRKEVLQEGVESRVEVTPEVVKYAKVYCLFCYKTCSVPKSRNGGSQSDDGIRTEVCQAFYHQLCKMSGIDEESDGDKENVSREYETFNGNSDVEYSACTDCFFVVKMYNELFQQMRQLKVTLKGHLKSLFNVMRLAGQVAPRVKEFHASFKNPRKKKKMGRPRKVPEVNNPQVQLEDVLEVRARIYKSCAKQLKYSSSKKKVIPENFGGSEEIQPRHEPETDEIEIVGVIKKEPEEPEDLLVEGDPSLFSQDELDSVFGWMPADASIISHSVFDMTASSIETDLDSSTPYTVPLYKCPKCPDVFATLDNLTNHTSTRHLDFTQLPQKTGSEFQCQHCSSTFDKLDDLVAHEMELHTAYGSGVITQSGKWGKGTKSVCGRCPELIPTRICDRVRHYIKQHQFLEGKVDETRAVVECPQCDKTFKEPTKTKAEIRLKNHKQLWHKNPEQKPEESTELQIKLDEKVTQQLLRRKRQSSPVFKSAKKIVAEMADTMKELGKGQKFKWICNVCDLNCKYPARLEDHLRKHTGEKPHVCQICNRGFNQKHHKERHLKLVHKNKKNKK